MVGVGRVLDPGLGSQAKFETRAVGKCSHPIIADLLVADEGPFVFAEQESVGQWNQFLARLVDEGIRARETQVLAVGGDAFVRTALDRSQLEHPPETQWPVAGSALIIQGQ